MTEFKVGDVVECVEESKYDYPGVVGVHYRVAGLRDHGALLLDIADDIGVSPERFELVTPGVSEVRTTSSTGGQKGTKPQRYDLMPKAGLDAISEVFAFGAEKYDSHNWRKGYEWGKSYSAAMRHLTAHWDGETLDKESGLAHLAHAGCHILFMLTWLHEQGEGGQFDDRFVNPSIGS